MFGRRTGHVLLLVLGSGCTCHPQVGLQEVCGTSVTPPDLDFGSVEIGQAPSQTLTVSNTSNGTLTVISAVATGDDSFTVAAFQSSQITAGGSLPVQVVFSPTTPGPHTATLQITTSGNCKSPTLDVTLTGIGVLLAASIAPTSLEFGCEVIGGSSPPQSLVVTNAANPPEAETVTVSRVSAPDFQLSSGDSAFELAPDASVSVSVVFAPSSLGPKQETLDVAICAEDGGPCLSPTQVALSGEGAGTALIAAPDPVSFPFLPPGDTLSEVVSVTAVALGDGGSCALPATISGPSLLYGDAGFELLDAGSTGGWPAVLAPPQWLPLLVQFTGFDGGLSSDLAIVPFSVDGIAQQTLDIPLDAQVVPGPCQLTVSPPAISFGTVTTGQTAVEPVSVCNGGDAFCDLSSLAVGQNDAANEFSVSDAGIQAPAAFAPGQCETVEMAFTAENTSPPLMRRGTLDLVAEEIGGDAGRSYVTVPLSATVANWAYPGQVLVAGGVDQNNQTLSSAEIYDMDAGTWTATQFGLVTPRSWHMANLLSSGKILIAGGVGSGSTYLSSSEIYDPSTGLFTATPGTMDYSPGNLPIASVLPSGKVLVAGGDSPAGFFANADLFDPATGTWSPTGPLPEGLNNSSWGLLPTGEVLFTEGAPVCCYQTDAPTSELYDPGTGTWTASGPVAEEAIWNAGVVLLSGDFLVVGGLNTSNSPTADCELYDPTSNTWSMTGSLGTARTTLGMVVLLPNGTALAAGGSLGAPIASSEIYDPSTGTWSATGSLNTARSNATLTVLPNGTVLAAGGYDGSQAISSCEIYDPSIGIWTPTGSLSTPRLYHTATLLPQ